MTITLLDLYNTAASQEWAMYDNDATSNAELEPSLVLAINKAILEIYTKNDFSFRERTHIILTIPKINIYDMPQGIIRQDDSERYLVKYNSEILEHIKETTLLKEQSGIPNGFYIKGNEIIFYPIPEEKGIVTIEYYTLAIGEDKFGKEIYSLQDCEDKLTVPVYLEALLKDAIITRTMLNTIASETDENYSAYKKQAEKSLKLLIKYSKGINQKKKIQI